MKKISILIALLLSMSIQLEAQTPESLAEMKCGACHLIGKITKEKLKNMKAPPYWALAKKIKASYPTREEGVRFLVDYTLNPSQEKMLFPKETKEKFGIMPSQKGLVSEAELQIISTYIFGGK